MHAVGVREYGNDSNDLDGLGGRGRVSETSVSLDSLHALAEA
jgi:hypothetical protein